MGYSDARKSEILAAYQERASLRGLTRIFDISRQTVTAWLKEQAEAHDVLELNELWSFVGCKAQVRCPVLHRLLRVTAVCSPKSSTRR